MHSSVLLYIATLCIGNCIAQNNITQSNGESFVHKKGKDAKALNEAIVDAQTNAVILSGGNISFNSINETVNTTESKKGTGDKKYKTSGEYSAKDKFILQHSINAMVKSIEIKSDTVWLSKNKFKITVTGKFEVDLKDMGNYISDYVNNTGKKIKIEVKENDCYGESYKYLSEYINSRQNNFLFSKESWPLGEADYRMEIFSDRLVLYDKRFRPNTIIRSYTYNNCQSLIDKSNTENKILDEIINNIYAVYIYKSVK